MRFPLLMTTASVALSIALAGFSPASIAETNCPVGGGAALNSPGGALPDRCEEGYAHLSGFLGYLQARLQLTPDQQPLWDRWQQKLQAAALAERSSCQADRATMSSKPNALQREDAILKMMSTRIDAIKSSRPELQALYRALTPAQQEVFDRLWPPMPPPPRLAKRADADQAPGGQAPAGGRQPALPEP